MPGQPRKQGQQQGPQDRLPRRLALVYQAAAELANAQTQGDPKRAESWGRLLRRRAQALAEDLTDTLNPRPAETPASCPRGGSGGDLGGDRDPVTPG